MRPRAECASRAPVTWPYLFRHTDLIYGLELLALSAFSEDRESYLWGTTCWVCLGNNNCLDALILGDSNTDVIAILVAMFWQMAQRFDIFVWISHVWSTLNPADLPTRGEKLPAKASSRCSIRSLKNLFLACRKRCARDSRSPHRPKLGNAKGVRLAHRKGYTTRRK